MSILALNHVQITIPVGKENSAKDFYCEFLGLTEIDKPIALQTRGGFWLQLNGFPIHVGTENGVDRKLSKAHLAYEVSDLEVWRSRLTARGIDIMKGIKIPFYERFEFRDPFGNRVEFLQRSHD